MAKQTLNGPLDTHRPFNLSDGTEHGDTPFGIIAKLNAMFTELYTAALRLTTFGAGSAVINGEGNINSQVPGVTAGIQPGGTGVDSVLAVFSIPASSFDAAGRGVAILAAGNFGATGNTKRVKLFLNPSAAVVGSAITGGTLISDSGAVTQNGGAWVLNGELYKRGATGSNTQVAVPGGVLLSGSHAGASAPCAEVTATESGAILVAVTGNATTAVSDIILALFQVNAMN